MGGRSGGRGDLQLQIVYLQPSSTGVQGYHKVSLSFVILADVGAQLFLFVCLCNYVPAGGIIVWGDTPYLFKVIKLAHVMK